MSVTELALYKFN